MYEHIICSTDAISQMEGLAKDTNLFRPSRRDFSCSQLLYRGASRGL